MRFREALGYINWGSELQSYKDYMVFGLLADWDQHTQANSQHWWHDLLVDAEVVVLEKPDETS